MLMAFNLIPIPPLDGSHVLMELLPYRVRYSDGFMKFEKFAPMVLLALILMGSFTNVDVLQLIVNIIAFPAEFVISLICGFIGYLGYL
jgi:Zn-dependent protease